MFVPPWLRQLQRYWSSHRSFTIRNTSRRPSVSRRVRLSLEALEDRFAPAADSVSTVAANVSATFSEAPQTLSLKADLSDTSNPTTPITEGTVTFTVEDSSSKPVGSPVQGTVSSTATGGGTASASFSLPANEAAGKYTIDVSYSDGSAFTDGGDTPGTLTVNPASVKVVGGNSTASFSTSSQTVALTATVSNDSFPTDTVGEGTVTFTVKDKNGFTVGSSVQGTVSAGKASANFSLPANSAPGSYTVAVVYTDSSGNFSDDKTDTAGKLTVGAASTTTQASDATADFSSGSQKVTLNATVTSSNGIVNEGNVAFTLVDSNGNDIGTTTTSPVANGSASVSYALPAGTATGSYTIQAAYLDSVGNFSASSDDSHTLTVGAAAATSLSLRTITITPNVANGTAQLTVTAQVSNSGGTVNEGSLSFSVAGVSAQANVSNGTATAQLPVSVQGVLNGFDVNLAYTDTATSASFANNTATLGVSTNVWNSLLPANLTFDSSHNETMQFTVGNVPLFGASYAASTGLLSGVSFGTLSVPMTYTNLGNNQLAALGGIPWGLLFRDSSGNFLGIADVETGPDGSLQWVFYSANHQILGETPYGM